MTSVDNTSNHVLPIFPQTAYVDVCDDTTYASRAKSFKNRAIAANIPAITTGGIYPGVSNGAFILILLISFNILIVTYILETNKAK